MIIKRIIFKAIDGTPPIPKGSRVFRSVSDNINEFLGIAGGFSISTETGIMRQEVALITGDAMVAKHNTEIPWKGITTKPPILDNVDAAGRPVYACVAE